MNTTRREALATTVAEHSKRPNPGSTPNTFPCVVSGGAVGSGTAKLSNGGGCGASLSAGPEPPRTTSSGRASAIRSAVQ